MESATEVITCSWDHTIRLWDAEMATLKTELVGNKAFFDVSYSPEKKMLLAASCERTIRMYDPRSTEGKLFPYPMELEFVKCRDELISLIFQLITISRIYD